MKKSYVRNTKSIILIYLINLIQYLHLSPDNLGSVLNPASLPSASPRLRIFHNTNKRFYIFFSKIRRFLLKPYPTSLTITKHICQKFVACKELMFTAKMTISVITIVFPVEKKRCSTWDNIWFSEKKNVFLKVTSHKILYIRIYLNCFVGLYIL